MRGRTAPLSSGRVKLSGMVRVKGELWPSRVGPAVMFALNSVFHVPAFGLLGWFCLDLLPGRRPGGRRRAPRISMWKIALSGVVGPLIEVPVLVALVHVSPARRRKFSPSRRLTAVARES